MPQASAAQLDAFDASTFPIAAPQVQQPLSVSATAPVQPPQPTATPPVPAPNAATTALWQPSVPRDKNALQAVATAVGLAEGVGTSPKGAINGLMPATAKELGVDPRNTDQAAYGRAKYLAQQYDKYGNWDDALVAFNWGPTNVDKWIKAGRSPSKLPAETQAYVQRVLGQAGLTQLASTAVTSGKRQVTLEELDEFEDKVFPRAGAAVGGGVNQAAIDAAADRDVAGAGSAEEVPGQATPSQDKSGGLPGAVVRAVEDIPASAFETGAQAEALVAGAAKGVAGLVLGPTQAALEQLSPDAAARFTSTVNDWEDRLGLTGAEAKHPAFGMAGNVIGTTGALLEAGGLLGATKAWPLVRQALSSGFRRTAASATVGFGLGATTFKPDLDDPWPRWLEGAVGATFGAAGAAVGEVVSKAAGSLVNRQAYQRFLGMLQGAVGDLGRNTGELKAAFLSYYKKLWDRKNALYTIRNAAGREFEGFYPEELSAAVRGAVPKVAREAGVYTTITTAKVREELGLPVHEARKAAHEQAVKQHAADVARWQKDVDSKVANVPPAARPMVLSSLEGRGDIPLRPVAPDPFEAQPVPASNFSAAIDAINAQLKAREGDGRSRAQLLALKDALMGVAKQTAEDFGEEPERFLRRADAASRFFAENIGPIKDLLGGGGRKTFSPTQMERGVVKNGVDQFSNAAFFDRFVKTLRANRTADMRGMAKAMGPQAREAMGRIVGWEMLQAGTHDATGRIPVTKGTANIVKYIADRKDGLIELMGRDMVTQLEGQARIAQELANEPPERYRNWWIFGHSILPAIGLERFVQNTAKGDPARGVEEALPLIAAGVMVPQLFNTLGRLKSIPYVLPLVKEAAKLKPGSPELAHVMRQIEIKAAFKGAVTGRVVSQSVQPEPSGGEGVDEVPEVPDR